MKRILSVFALCLLCAAGATFAQKENVIRLEAAAGEDIQYRMSDLLRVEFEGDSIRFIASDGTLFAQVYKYNYTLLEVVKTPPTSVESETDTPAPLTAQKILLNGQIYIRFGDKLFTLQGASIER